MQASAVFEKIIERLEDFLVRSLLPVTIFFFQFVTIDFLFFQNEYLHKFRSFVVDFNDVKGSGWWLFALLLGFGFFVRVFQEFPDWWNKGDYFSCFTDEKSTFKALRQEVKDHLCCDERVYLKCSFIRQLKDYELYLLISQLISGSKKYVDEVRVIYMIFFSLFLNSWLFLGFANSERFGEHVLILAALVGLVAFFLAVCIARERYISRNFRLYLSYFVKESNR